MKALLRKRLPRGVLVGGILTFGLLLAGCDVLVAAFTYQGRLLNSSGAPVPDGNYTFDFGLWDASSGGTKVCTDAGNTVSVTDGLFDATVVGCDVEVYRSPLWLEVTVESETLSPRQQLRGAPFANSLAGGAVVQAFEPLGRTLDGQPDTGAGLAVFNSDNTTLGGHGLMVGNAAAGGIAGATAALAARAQGNGYGAIIESLGYRGMHVTATSGKFDAVFAGDFGISVAGSCFGCRLGYVAKNDGSAAIRPGDLLVPTGVTEDPDLGIPVMLVRAASSLDDSIVGVAERAVQRSEVHERNGWTTGGFDGGEGDIAPGGYLSVVVDGLVQVRADQFSSVSIGERASLASDGSIEQSVGTIMSGVSSDGLVWILLGGG